MALEGAPERHALNREIRKNLIFVVTVSAITDNFIT